ncbi:MAG: glycosyltransferase family 2 protein [Bacteroidaceae bacterium]|nr:glycosyltransferase family 2 protein [Bacteroidaceae bacterium]
MEITVIVPVKDRRDHIGKTLDSILKAGIPPKEVIIVDNESTDGTYQFCEQYIKNRPNMTLLRETFPGAAAARNKGLKSCKTEWVYFFDSDDLFDYNFISTFHDLKPEGYDLIAVPTKQRTQDGKEHVRTYITSDDPRVQLLASVLNTPGMLFRTSFLKDIGAWNPSCRIWDDWELGLRTMLHQPRVLWYTGHAFHTIRLHEDSLTGSSFSMNYKEIIRTLTIIIAHLQSSILQPLSTYHAQHLDCLYPHLDLLMYPLYLRTCILLGKIQNEQFRGKSRNYKMASKALTIFRNDNFQTTFSQRLTGGLMRLYTMLGGRGAWRWALSISQSKRSRKVKK